MSAKLTELSRISTVDTGDLIYVARTVGDTGVSAAMSRADFEDNLHIKLSLAQDTGKYLADSGVFLGPLFKGDTGDVALWRTDGTVGEGPKLPQGTATGGTLADTGTAQTLSGKSLSGSSIVDTGVHLAAYFAGGVGADTGTFLRGDGNWRQIQLARASDTGRYLADQGQFVIPSAATTAGIQAAIDSVSSGSAVRVKLLGTAYDLSGGSVTNNGRIVSWDIDPRATFTGAGTLPAISSPNYGGHTLKDGVQIYLTKGTEATPVSTGGSPLVTAAYGDTAAVAVAGHSTFAYKMTSASGARVRALYSESVDPTGGTGTFIEGARNMAVLTGGTLGSAYGVIGFAGQSTTTQYDYMVAFEADLKDDFADAPDPGSFSSSSFSAGVVFSNSGTKKADAMLVANPFTSVPYRVGFLAAGAIDHSIIYGKTTVQYGINFLEGIYSTAEIALSDSGKVAVGDTVLARTSAGILKIGSNNIITATTSNQSVGGKFGIGPNTGTPAERLSVGYGENIDLSFGSATSMKSYLGTFNDELVLAMNRRVSDGVYAQAGLPTADIKMALDSGDSSIRFGTSTTNGSGTTTERLRIRANGEIAHASNVHVIVDANTHLGLRSYTVATLPSAGTAARMIYVSNGTSNKRLAVADGTNWRWPDGAIVS